MADSKLSALDAITAFGLTDNIYVDDTSAGASKRIIVSNMLTLEAAAANTAGTDWLIKGQDAGADGGATPDGGDLRFEAGAADGGTDGLVEITRPGGTPGTSALQISFGVGGTDSVLIQSKGDDLFLQNDHGVRLQLNSTVFFNFHQSGKSNPQIQLRPQETTGTELKLVSAGQFTWSSSATNVQTAADTGLKRASAGVVQVTDGSTGVGGLISGDHDPDGDGTRDLGTQTTAQWANVWADAVNGADFIMANGVRLLESELYGYGRGFAIGYSSKWEDGKAIWHGSDEEKAKWMADARPWFVVEEDFIEIHGRRITPEQLDKLLALA